MADSEDDKESSKVIGLFGSAPGVQPDPKIVARLEDLLEQAKRGEIKALAYATVKGNEDISGGWEVGTNMLNLTSASLAQLVWRFQKQVYDRLV